MFEVINQKLREAKEQIRLRDKWSTRLEQYRTDLAKETETLRQAEQTLRTEEETLRKLEGFTLSHLFAELLGHHEENVETSRRALLTAKLKADTARAAIKALETDISDLEERLRVLGGIDNTYAALLKEKETLLLQAHTPEAEAVFELGSREAELKSRLKELEEAIAASQPVLTSLNDCLESLEKARDWGTLDMFGGGIAATAVKHDHLHDAQYAVNEAGYYLRAFHRELQDLHMDLDIQIEEQGFMNFADYFLDGLFVDWMVQNRIQESQQRVSEQFAVVESLCARLEEQHSQVQAELQSVLDERKIKLESLE